MEIIKDLKYLPNLSLALGFFDGMHLGHQEVIKSAIYWANSMHVQSAVVTFNVHPRTYLEQKEPKYIISIEDKYKMMESLGIDYVVELDFEKIFRIPAENYIRDILIKYFSPISISTGFNHHFGAGNTGGVNLLSDFQTRYDYTFSATPLQKIYGACISSSSIRKYISAGAMDMAGEMLGRRFSIEGVVEKGEGIGHSLGFPTANITYPEGIIEISTGVYEACVILEDNRTIKAIANYGDAPTISENGSRKLEVFLLDFDENLYDKKIKVEFYKLLRPEKKFENTDELKNQISLDIQNMLESM